MYTRRHLARVVVTTLLGVAMASNGAAAEDAAAHWWREGRPVLVVLTVDGLRAAALTQQAPWDGPLMPHLESLRDRCLRFDDVWTELADRDGSFRQLVLGSSPVNALLDGGSSTPPSPGFGQRVEVFEPPHGEWDFEELWARIQRLSQNDGGVLVVRLRDLEFPLGVDVSTLEQLDPRPWTAKSAGPVEIELLAQKRLNQAVLVARSDRPRRGKLNDHDLEIYSWVVDAAHRALDRKLARIFEGLRDRVESARLSWILTSTGATAYGRHGLDTLGEGAVVETLHVPLWWRLPEALDLHEVRGEPRVLRDLGRTLAGWTAGRASAGLFGSGSAERFAFASGVRRAGRLWQDWSHMRWATEEFALLDLATTPPRVELFDRRVDPGERTPRGAESEALWDSLRSELCRRTLGDEVELRVTTTLGEATVIQFAVDAPPGQLRILDGAPAGALPYAGGSLVRWTVDGPGPSSLRLALPSSMAGLRLRADWTGAGQVALGRAPRALPAQGELRILPNTLPFVRMLEEPEPGRAPLTMQWIVQGWWVAR